MAFPREATRTPAGIGNLEVRLFSPDPTGSDAPEAAFVVHVKMSDGSVVVRTGNLIPHITTAQRNALLAFMDSLRTQAVSEFLP